MQICILLGLANMKVLSSNTKDTFQLSLHGLAYTCVILLKGKYVIKHSSVNFPQTNLNTVLEIEKRLGWEVRVVYK